MTVAASVLISLDVKSFDRHGFPWLQSTKHIYNIDNIYKKSTFSPPWVFTKLSCNTLPSHISSSFLPLGSPSPTVQRQPNCNFVLRLGSRGTELLPLQLPSMCNACLHSLIPPSKRARKLETQSSQTMKEFWFFNFSSSLICCLKNSILWERQKEPWEYFLHWKKANNQGKYILLPLLAECCLYFTDSNQRPQIFELSAVLRHANAAHGVSLFSKSWCLWDVWHKLHFIPHCKW